MQNYANACQNCQNLIRDAWELAGYREPREVFVVSQGSDEIEPIYETPVDNNVRAIEMDTGSGPF